MRPNYTTNPEEYRLSLRTLREAVGGGALRQLINERCVRKVYRMGQEIFTEGDRMEFIYFVYDGKVKIARRTPQGRYITSRLVGVGQCFGLRSYFSTSARATVRAEAFDEHVTIYKLPVEVLEEVMSQSTKASRLIITALSDELERIEERTAALLTKHLRARLADVVLLLLQAYGVLEDGRTIDFEFRLAEVSALGNMTVANASRTMSEFVRSGVVLRVGRRIKILDRPRLELISQEKA